ncbi:MAG: methionine--tRNA ligase [Candidatus Hadarchaeales archaeon]
MEIGGCMGKFYITTPIYYINAVPHIGHAYTTVIADIIARWRRLAGDDVFFLTGLDENSSKTVEAAENMGFENPQEYADWMAEKWKNVWRILCISNNDFIRTTEERHKKRVQEIFQRLLEKGEIYPGIYEGLYCDGCEAYVSEEDLVDGKCPLHGTEPKKVKEENYFFRLSAYRDTLLEHLRNNPDFIIPEARRNEVVSFLQRGLKDVSVTRRGLKWGIEVPGDPEQRIWVWFDALINYLVAQDYWPADVHLIAKDILRFHCILWPAMLMAANYPLPKKILSHGFLTVNGRKISKSLGNVIDPVYLAEKYSPDVLRYFLAREISLGQDGDFSEENLRRRLNDELADVLGNFIHRVLTFIHARYNGRAPEGELDREFLEEVNKRVREIIRLMDRFEVTRAAEEIVNLARLGNEYFQRCKPWESISTKPAEAAKCLLSCLNLVGTICVLLSPFMPITAERLSKQMNFKVERLDQALRPGILPGHEIGKPEPLFRKAQDEKTAEAAVSREVTVSDFEKMDIRIAKVLSCEKIKGSEKLLKLSVDVGGEVRTIVAGIGKSYSPEDLVGRLVVVVVNMKPAKIMGVVSHGMLLAAGDDENKLSLLVPDRTQEPGTKVR